MALFTWLLARLDSLSNLPSSAMTVMTSAPETMGPPRHCEGEALAGRQRGYDTAGEPHRGTGAVGIEGHIDIIGVLATHIAHGGRDGRVLVLNRTGGRYANVRSEYRHIGQIDRYDDGYLGVALGDGRGIIIQAYLRRRYSVGHFCHHTGKCRSPDSCHNTFWHPS